MYYNQNYTYKKCKAVLTEEKAHVQNDELLNFSNCKQDLHISANICKKLMNMVMSNKMTVSFKNQKQVILLHLV